MANIQSITYDTVEQKYIVTLDAETTEEQVFSTFLGIWNLDTIGKISSVTGYTYTIPAGVTSFESNVVDPNTYYVELEGVVADDIATADDIGSIEFANDTFTVNLNPLEKAKSFAIGVSADYPTVSILEIEGGEPISLKASTLSEVTTAARPPASFARPMYLKDTDSTSVITVDIYYTLISIQRTVTLTIAGYQADASVTSSTVVLPSAAEPTDITAIQASGELVGSATGTAITSTTVTGTSVAFDYSEHLNALIDAVNNLTLATNTSTAIARDSAVNTIAAIEELAETLTADNDAFRSVHEEIRDIQQALYDLLNDGDGAKIRDIYALIGDSVADLAQFYLDAGVDAETVQSAVADYINQKFS